MSRATIRELLRETWLREKYYQRTLWANNWRTFAAFACGGFLMVLERTTWGVIVAAVALALLTKFPKSDLPMMTRAFWQTIRRRAVLPDRKEG